MLGHPILGHTAHTAHPRRAAWFRRSAAVISSLVLILCARSASAREPSPTEYQVKAAFLLNFAKFIEWPSSSFANPQAPFLICILGTDPFGPMIDETLHGQTLGGRAVAVQRVRDAGALRHCQVGFISTSEKKRVQDIIEAVKGASVLLVGESPQFAAAGGMIQFGMEDDHVRFLINPEAAERAGLRVSSKLLSLATIIHDAASNEKSGGS